MHLVPIPLPAAAEALVVEAFFKLTLALLALEEIDSTHPASEVIRCLLADLHALRAPEG